MNRNKKTKAVKSNKAISYIELNNNLQSSDSINSNITSSVDTMLKKESESFR